MIQGLGTDSSQFDSQKPTARIIIVEPVGDYPRDLIIRTLQLT